MSNTSHIDTQESLYAQPIRWSGVAITAFVTAFLIAPLGVLLGIIGIFHTSGGKRKGMGLSIAAIPIGLVVSVVVAGMVGVGYMFYAAGQASRRSMAVLKASQVRVAESTEAFYETYASPRLRVNVDEAAFRAWLEGVVETHGPLQQIRQANPMVDQAGDRFKFNYDGKFVNGSARVSVTVGFDGSFTPEIDDVEVDGVSVMESVSKTSGDGGQESE